MSKYTTEVRFICEYYAGLKESVDLNDVNQVITNSREQIFNFYYPIFNEEYRAQLEQKILRHYYTREIGFETVGLWRLKLQTAMCEIMPYYNELYKSALFEFNPLYDTDINIIHDLINENKTELNKNETNKELKNRYENGSSDENYSRNKLDNKTENVTTNSNSWDLYSDTPQGAVQNIKNKTYLTNARNIDNNETGNSTTRNDSNINDNRNIKSNVTYNESNDITKNGVENTIENKNERYKEKISGKRGSQSYSELLLKFRETIINIDLMIINELEDLFMGLW